MMEYLHTMVRVGNIEQSLDFYCKKMGLVEVRRSENEKGRFTLIFLVAPGDVESFSKNMSPALELTYNWDEHEYSGGRNFVKIPIEQEGGLLYKPRSHSAGVAKWQTQ